jgi:tetratricopeptide (TPR) repeat protein
MALFTLNQLQTVEGYLAQDQVGDILPALEGLVHDMEVYIDEECAVTDEVQYFSFASAFQKLTYRRVEKDPRKLVDAPAPFDRAYADYAFALVRMNDLEAAAEALKQAVRWNPMNCAHRLDLAAVLAQAGDYEEHLKLSYSVFARAASSAHLVRAYLNFEDYFERCQQFETAAACVKCALRLLPQDKKAVSAASKLALEHQCDPNAQADELTSSLLAEQGIPEGANVEVVLSALLLADISAAQGDMATCQDMACVAVDLVGQQKATALAELVRESGEKNFSDDAEGSASTANEYASPAAQATLDDAVAAAQAE